VGKKICEGLRWDHTHLFIVKKLGISKKFAFKNAYFYDIIRQIILGGKQYDNI